VADVFFDGRIQSIIGYRTQRQPGEDGADDRHTGVGDEAVHMEWMLARQWKKWASGFFWLQGCPPVQHGFCFARISVSRSSTRSEAPHALFTTACLPVERAIGSNRRVRGTKLFSYSGEAFGGVSTVKAERS
jgi:hypothetical protein